MRFKESGNRASNGYTRLLLQEMAVESSRQGATSTSFACRDCGVRYSQRSLCKDMHLAFQSKPKPTTIQTNFSCLQSDLLKQLEHS